jgi:hypothetical protein
VVFKILALSGFSQDGLDLEGAAEGGPARAMRWILDATRLDSGSVNQGPQGVPGAETSSGLRCLD